MVCWIAFVDLAPWNLSTVTQWDGVFRCLWLLYRSTPEITIYDALLVGGSWPTESVTSKTGKPDFSEIVLKELSCSYLWFAQLRFLLVQHEGQGHRHCHGEPEMQGVQGPVENKWTRLHANKVSNLGFNYNRVMHQVLTMPNQDMFLEASHTGKSWPIQLPICWTIDWLTAFGWELWTGWSTTMVL